MKQIVYIISILFLSINSYAQTNLDAVLQGTIVNAKSNFIELKYLNNPLDDSLSSVRIELNEKGQFYFELPINRPLDAQIIHNNQSAPLYIEPSERIEISILADDVFRSINYNSTNFNNHYLIAYKKKYEHQRNIYDRNKHILNDDAIQYVKYENDLVDEKLKFLANYHKENNLSSTFLRRQKAAIEYGSANQKFTFAGKYKLLTNNTKVLYENYNAFMLQFSTEENDLITVPEFYEFLENLFIYKLETTPYKATNESELVSYTYNIAHSLYKDRVQNIFITKKFGELLDKYAYEQTSKYISNYMSTVYQTEYRNYIDKKITKASTRD